MSINYTSLRSSKDPARTSERLLRLRHGCLKSVLEARNDHSFLLATWNLRDFDGPKFGWAPRSDEAFFYIAEVISAFDLVAVQEVKADLQPFERLVKILGSSEWDYLVTDANPAGRSGGNGERMAFVYRKSKVSFRRVAGEVVLPTGQEIVDPESVKPAAVAPAEALAVAAEAAATDTPGESKETSKLLQFARSPYLVSFRAGWFNFSLCTVHIFYGDDSGPELVRRIREIESLVKFFANRQDAEVAAARKARKAKAERGESVELTGHDPAVENYILLGDFNVVSPEHQTMEALTSRGFHVPEAIDGKALDASMREHFYDQIAARVKDGRYSVSGGGIVHVFDDVYTDDDFEHYRASLPSRDPEPQAKYRADTPEEIYRKWRTWQMSDHVPLWIRIETDFADGYLADIANR